MCHFLFRSTCCELENSLKTVQNAISWRKFHFASRANPISWRKFHFASRANPISWRKFHFASRVNPIS